MKNFSTSLGAVNNVKIPANVIAEFNRKINKIINDVTAITMQVSAAVKKKEETWDLWAKLYYTVKDKGSEVDILLSDIGLLRTNIMQADFATGEPILFVRPQDALDYITSMSSIIKTQGQALAKWADVGFLESGFDNFTDALSDTIAWTADYMARVGASSAAKVLAKGGRDIQRGRIPYLTIAVAGTAVVAGFIAWRKFVK